jgi:hypothetical protein
MQAFTNVKTAIKNPVTGEEHMQHHPYTSEVTYPKSGKVIKEKTD